MRKDSKPTTADDERREKIIRRLTPFDLYKLTPKTSCRECGFASCLAFSTQAVVGQADIGACPYIESEERRKFGGRLAEQLSDGIGVQREGFEQALQFLRGEMLERDFGVIAGSLGAKYFEADGKPALGLVYFGREITVTAEDIIEPGSGASFNPYEKILIFNYVLSGGAEPSGTWVGMESLPNSVSKIKSLRSRCQEPLARASAGRMQFLPAVVAGIGNEFSASGEKVDFSSEFKVLPRLSIRVLWWDEDPSENFHAQVKFLFDSRVLSVLDLESLLFCCELIANMLLERLQAVE